jgi:hypothetical protein
MAESIAIISDTTSIILKGSLFSEKTSLTA